jgi:hypothetical protein
VKRVVDWAQIVQALGGQTKLEGMAALDTLLAEIGFDLGVPAHLIYTMDMRKQIAKTVQTLVTQALQAAAEQQQAAAAPPPAPNGDPNNALVAA